jgi:HEAT repeat protein
MALTSPTDIETRIYPFLDDEDMYVQERAIELLGFHQYQPAVAKLTDLATNAKPNGRTAAKIALKKISASGV